MEVSQVQADRKAGNRAQPAQAEPAERSPLESTSISASSERKSELQRENAALSKSSSSQQAQSADRSDAPDPRLLEMQTQQRALQEKLDQQQTLIRGTELNIASTQKDAETGGVTGFFMWSSGTKGAMQKEISSMQELNKARNEKTEEMTAALERQREASRQFSKLEQQGRERQAKGDIAGAQDAFNAAQKIFVSSQGAAQPDLVIDNAAYRDQQKQVSAGLNKSIQNLDTTENVLRITQKVAIVAGATVATGGAALAVGGVAGAAVGVAAGTAYGTGVGGTAALAEASGHIALGNKTTEQALTDAGNQTLESARDSAIASVGTVVGIGVGGHVAGGVAARLGTSVGAKIVTGMANGAAAGATSAVVSTTANTGIEYAAATREFAKQYDSANLSLADREIVYNKFMEERGLTASGIAQRYAHDVSIGALGGAVGGATGAGKDLAGASRRAVVSIEGGQFVADIGIGLGDAAVNGQFNAEGITSSIAGAVVGNVSGRVSQRNHAAGQTSDGGDLPPPTSKITDGPEQVILRMEDYRQQTSNHEIQSQPQEMRLAAGAESMSANENSIPGQAGREQNSRPVTIKMNKDQEPVHQRDATPAVVEKAPADSPANVQEPVASISSRQPFDGLTAAQIENDRPPPTGVPTEEYSAKGPYTANSGSDRYEINTKVAKDAFTYPDELPPSPKATEAKVEMYYHNYGQNSDYPANWRYNVTVGKNEYVAIRPSADANGPFAYSDLTVVPRGSSNHQKVVDAAESFVGGTATPKQAAMLKGTWKGMEQLHERIDVIAEKSLLPPEDISRIKDIMRRGHFIPGTYLSETR